MAADVLNIADHFLGDRLREGGGDRIALRLDDGTRTYADVERAAARVASALRGLGVRQEERVVVALPDGEAFVATVFGVLKLGAVVVMVNPALGPDALRGILDYGRVPVAVVTADVIGSFARAAAGGREAPPHLLVVDGVTDTPGAQPPPDAATPPGGYTMLRDTGLGDERETVATHRDDPAVWLFSGGTTGRPKAVVQTHASFANAADCYARQAMGYRDDDIAIGVPKLFFGYALGAVLLFPFACGGSAMLFAERPTPAALCDRIEAHRPTVLVTVPSMIATMLDDPETARRDLSSVRFATSAGEALPVTLYQRWTARVGIPLYDGLGTAEQWHIFVSNRPGAVRPGTVGTAVPGYDVEARDDEGQPVPPGDVGRLWVKGGSRAIAYWRDMPRTRQVFRGEWVVTGDLITKDAEGYVTYVGRGDDALKVKGRWLLPAEVESCLLDHAHVVECAVVGAPDPDGLTRPVAFVVASVDDPGLPEVLRRFALDRLEPYKHPRRVIVVDDLPRTHLGKVDRTALRRRAGVT